MRELIDRPRPREGSLWARGWRPPSAGDLVGLRNRARRMTAAVECHGMLGVGDAEGSDLLARLEEQDTRGLADSGWLDRVEAIERVNARLAALRAEAIAAFDDVTRGVSADLGHELPEPADRPARAGERRWHGGLLRSVADEIGLALNLHRGAANARIHRSWELVKNYPATLAALSDGTLTERAAFTIIDELGTLSDDAQAAEAETALLDWARTHPLQRIKQRARREVASRDAAATDRIRRRTIEQRALRLVSDECGTADLVSTHDALAAAAAMTSITRAAIHARRHGDPRSLDQLRADIALSRMLGRADSSPAPASSTGTVPTDPVNTEAVNTEVVIHATAAELMALVDQLPGTGGEVAGHGVLPLSALVDALTRSTTTVRVHVADRPPPSPPRRYVPSRRLDRWIRDRDRICRFPGCGRPATRADLDHRRRFDPDDPDGGRTTADNLHALYRHHHRLKHRGAWRIRIDADGTITWISPTGREYRDDCDP